MELATNWVFKPNAMQLLQQLRKRVKAEFGFTLRFKEEQLAEQLARVKSKTVDDKTRSILGEIEVMRGVSFDQQESAKAGTYRGQSVVKEPAKQKDSSQLIYGEAPADNDKMRPEKSQKMYRGRPVVG